MTFRPNLGSADRVIRVVLGVVAALAAVFTAGSMPVWVPAILGLVAVVLLATAAAARCPAYLPMKLSTCSTPQ